MRPDELIFFVDRCLGAHTVPDALRAAGARVEVHAAHFTPNATDEEILRFVGERGWVFLSKDENIMRRKAERQALLDAHVAAFILNMGNAKGPVIAAAFVSALDRMTRICRTHERPVLATVSSSGAVAVREGVRRGGVRRR